jgi:hypothetical protein
MIGIVPPSYMVRSFSAFSSAAWRKRADMTMHSSPAIRKDGHEQRVVCEQRHQAAIKTQAPHRPAQGGGRDEEAAYRRPPHIGRIFKGESVPGQDGVQHPAGLPQDDGGADAAKQ